MNQNGAYTSMLAVAAIMLISAAAVQLVVPAEERGAAGIGSYTEIKRAWLNAYYLECTGNHAALGEFAQATGVDCGAENGRISCKGNGIEYAKEFNC